MVQNKMEINTECVSIEKFWKIFSFT